MNLAQENEGLESELVETAHMILSTLDVEQLLYQIAVRLAKIAGMDSCAISSILPDPARVHVMAHYSHSGSPRQDHLATDYFLEAYPATARVLESGEPTLVHAKDPHADPAEANLLRELNYQTLLMLPLKAGDRPVGLVEVYTEKPDFDVSATHV